jgi:hypothetical protein
MTEYTRLTPSDIYEIESRCGKESTDQIKRIFRDQPQGILAAYDTYASNTAIHALLSGVQTASSEVHSVLAWKQDLLDLKTEAFTNIPEKVGYYYTKYKNLGGDK